MEDKTWNFELENQQKEENEFLGFEKSIGSFVEPLNRQKAVKNEANASKDDDKGEVTFDKKTGKIIVRQKKIERVTGVKRTLDDFEQEKYARMAEESKVL